MGRVLHWLLLSAVVLLSACDRLDDSGVMAETLPGKWAFSYTASEDLGVGLSYQYVIFCDDGTCALVALVYPDGQLDGSYRAGEAAIRIDATLDDGSQHVMMWRVLSMSPYKIVADYAYQSGGDRTVTITLTLDKLN